VRAELLFLGAVVAMALVSMIAYRLSPQGRDHPVDASGRGGSFIFGFWVRDWFYWFMRPLRWVAIASGAPPLAFNLLGVALGLAAGAGFATGHLAIAGWMIFLSGIADVLDGEVARARGLTSSAGAFIDSTLDRFAELLVFVGLAVFFDSGLSNLVVIVALGGSLLVSYTRARGESLGVLCKLGIMQRAERMLALGFGAILDPTASQAAGRDEGFLLLIVLWMMAVGTIGTSIFRTIWIARQLGQK
jgi:phosphatidylglycerophosphate synthase